MNVPKKMVVDNGPGPAQSRGNLEVTNIQESKSKDIAERVDDICESLYEMVKSQLKNTKSFLVRIKGSNLINIQNRRLKDGVFKTHICKTLKRQLLKNIRDCLLYENSNPYQQECLELLVEINRYLSLQTLLQDQVKSEQLILFLDDLEGQSIQLKTLAKT
ncbi:hypothetical protein DID75_03720 [Candidatus Marinamargulisbacteria bacterium SCGC AG-410-N11]|nr:hypothetical protein DID75_03720 [Candidatus Marinamargulisbacteria bacterium SCGC AG-410-N11]